MTLGLTLQQFTILHTAISLIGIVTGFAVVFGLAGGRRVPGWTGVFLTFTVLTSITGFMFPPKPIGPPHIFGILSLVILMAVLYAIYGAKLKGSWRWIYVVGALVAQYLNVVVLVAQSFNKIPALNALAPTQTNEPAFLIAQVVVLALFIVLGVRGVKRFRPLVSPAFA